MAKRNSTLIPAAGYARRSTDLQDRSIPDQKAYIEQWAKENGYKIVRWFIDDAISGTSTRGRDDFAQMIETAENGRDFDTILCYDISRFSRGGTNETGYYLHRLKMAGVNVLFPADGIPEGDEGELIQGVKSWQAKQFSVKLSRDVIRGQVSGLLTNRSVQGGRSPYGYDLQYVSRDGHVLRTIRRLADGTKHEFDPQGNFVRALPPGERVGKAKSDTVRLVPGNPDHVHVVKRIFAMYLNGIGNRSIALALNADGIPAPNGRGWLPAAIKDILANPVYRGSLAWNRSTSGKISTISGDGRAIARTERKRLRRKPQDQWIIIDDVHESLIGREDFERVQAERQRRAGLGGKARQTKRYLLSGLIKCLHCKYTFYGKRLGRGNYKPRYYLDGGHHRYGKQVCSHKQIPAKALEAWVVGKVREVILGDAKTVDAAINAFVKAVRARTPQKANGKSIDQELASVNNRIKATAAMLADPNLGEVDEIHQSLVRLKARRDALQAQLNRNAKPAQQAWTDSDLQTWAKKKLEGLDEALSSEHATPAARAVLAAFVDRIEIEHEGKRGTLYLIADAAEVLALTDTTRGWNGEPNHLVHQLIFFAGKSVSDGPADAIFQPPKP